MRPRKAHIANIFLSLFTAFLFSCNQSPIRVQMDYMSREYLASYHVKTPDARLLNAPVGVRLVISWSLPSTIAARDDTFILLYVVYGDFTEKVFTINPQKMVGYSTYCLLNNEYYEKCGIITYKAELYSEGCLIKTWYHQLWTEPITFEHEEKEEQIDFE